MTELYPEIEPYDRGMLDVGEGNLVYWEACGNPSGRPAVVIHDALSRPDSRNQLTA
jgi:proline iminopeptidase